MARLKRRRPGAVRSDPGVMIELQAARIRLGVIGPPPDGQRPRTQAEMIAALELGDVDPFVRAE